MRITGIELGLAAALLLIGALTVMQLTHLIQRGGQLSPDHRDNFGLRCSFNRLFNRVAE